MAKEKLVGEEIQLPEELVLYVVRNSSGQYFRAKGYGGYGSSWVDSNNKAKIYGKTSGARGVITWFATHHSGFPAPDLIMLKVGKAILIDEKSRVERAKAQKAIKEEQAELRRAKQALEYAQRNKQRAEEDLKKAKKMVENARIK